MLRFGLEPPSHYGKSGAPSVGGGTKHVHFKFGLKVYLSLLHFQLNYQKFNGLTYAGSF